MNISLFYFLHDLAFQYEWLDTLVWFFAEPFIYIVMASVMVYFLIHYKVFRAKDPEALLTGRAKEISLVFFSAGLGWFFAKILKFLIHTDRPFVVLDNVHSLFVESGYAFPSGHSATIAALSFAVYFKHKRLGYWCMAAALLIGLCRVIAGVHFPIDIIGGYILGFLVAFFVKNL